MPLLVNRQLRGSVQSPEGIQGPHWAVVTFISTDDRTIHSEYYVFLRELEWVSAVHELGQRSVEARVQFVAFHVDQVADVKTRNVVEISMRKAA